MFSGVFLNRVKSCCHFFFRLSDVFTFWQKKNHKSGFQFAKEFMELLPVYFFSLLFHFHKRNAIRVNFIQIVLTKIKETTLKLKH